LGCGTLSIILTVVLNKPERIDNMGKTVRVEIDTADLSKKVFVNAKSQL